ncbi:integral membrane protein [Sclerotinia borealis F-4128]|uniref:Integral membrane protein n=1 Tax=Sclerotinia borealis (strain F-4128) TaxID=1432307 RepID=W9C7X7_SCLBF|nr:integral membrane protein [Sclerotinia borealis F-4128]
MLLADVVSMCLRIGELAFSAVVAGLTGSYLHSIRGHSVWTKKRFIYTEIIAALGILVSLLLLLPFTWNYIHWPLDLLMFILFMVAFGLLANFIAPLHCGSVWNWHGITGKSTCSKWKADVAFTFLASIFFLASALLGMWVVYRHRRTTTSDQPTTTRRRWYRSRV